MTKHCLIGAWAGIWFTIGSLFTLAIAIDLLIREPWQYSHYLLLCSGIGYLLGSVLMIGQGEAFAGANVTSTSTNVNKGNEQTLSDLP